MAMARRGGTGLPRSVGAQGKAASRGTTRAPAEHGERALYGSAEAPRVRPVEVEHDQRSAVFAYVGLSVLSVVVAVLFSIFG